jgi:hypothetical protein
MDFSAAASQLFDVLGTAATYRAQSGDVSLTAIVRDDLPPDLLGGLVRVDQTVLDLLTAECGGHNAVQPGEGLVIGDIEYGIDRVESDDGLITRLVCSNRSG